VADDISSFLNR